MSGPIEPEIIDITPRASPLRFRKLPMIVSLLKGMALATIPAAGLLWCSIGLVQTIVAGELWATIPLILLAPFTLFFVLIAIPVNLFLLLSLFATLFGKSHVAVHFSSRAGGFRSMRTVHETGTGWDQIES